jgi:hypothetical protein
MVDLKGESTMSRKEELLKTLLDKKVQNTSDDFYGTLYDIVLKSGQELNCFTKGDFREVLQTYHANQKEFGLFVQENHDTKKVTFVRFEDISYFRFPRQGELSEANI